jgi:hypothetical protein
MKVKYKVGQWVYIPRGQFYKKGAPMTMVQIQEVNDKFKVRFVSYQARARTGMNYGFNQDHVIKAVPKSLCPS